MDFEKDIKDLELKIEELKKFSEEKGIDLKEQIDKLEELKADKMKSLYEEITPWQKTQIARHQNRPYTLDYIDLIIEDFVELHGDRLFKDDKSIIGGLGKIGNEKVVIIGHEKGRTLDDKIFRNFGSPNPEGYRKALRLMKLAERFNLPVISFIDTAGAYPGLEAEERGQGEAIARNLMEMAGLSIPTISIVIGEGGSGGALGIGVTDKIFMLENSYYSVISPEGCASILFRDASKACDAAEYLKLDAKHLLEFGIIDDIISEPLGGAHRNPEYTANNIKEKILSTLEELKSFEISLLKEIRYKKLKNIGKYNLI
ncbi:acetyl-CoA carboxylase carboxyltransferase subunit alpha [Hypnocyclicus thermotrophus]|uniref:Acetyl-coenzyme A carboxylase carboxyl transferase subunit alpha n=1 Tax=Hypnocyclicus thermotrophus TaxID=1627895 RepID=A0AA46DYN2_9FUSO|nr:acetyl-CoA carboxylase carboxyltransferase subunit alpha [Hypnocyclicus thermotrophus]TDT70467.1 acetyl-CoA carboxylase carboxyltransferase subunit alpha [Hypnocyclicus thermotrophus]